jgi:hypothetical protein
LVVVAIALLTIDNPHIPFEPVVEESGALPEHFFQQIPMPLRVRPFNDNNHLPTPVMISGSSRKNVLRVVWLA